MSIRRLTALAFVVGLLLSSGYTPTPSEQDGSMLMGELLQIRAPLGLSPAHVPAHSSPTAETISLGRRFDYDKNFSQARKKLVALPASMTGEITSEAGAYF